MTRLISEHFKRNGLPKKRFDTHGDAERERLRSNKASSYKCRFCKGWHVGGRAS